MDRNTAWVGIVALVAAWTVPSAGHPVVARHARCHVRPTYQYRVTSVPGRRIARLDVRFPRTCGTEVRAFLRHSAALGAQTDHGRAVRRDGGVSSVVTTAPTYCRLGWESHGRHGWRQVTLRSRGRC